MNADDLCSKIIEALGEIAPEADPGTIDPAVSFHDQLEIDSVDFMNLMLSLEKRLGIRIPEGDYPRLSTLAGCIQYLDGAMPRPLKKKA